MNYPELRIVTVHRDGKPVTSPDTRIYLEGTLLETVRDYTVLGSAVGDGQLVELAFYAHVEIHHEIEKR